jgi:hypothetical protein
VLNRFKMVALSATKYVELIRKSDVRNLQVKFANVVFGYWKHVRISLLSVTPMQFGW